MHWWSSELKLSSRRWTQKQIAMNQLNEITNFCQWDTHPLYGATDRSIPKMAKSVQNPNALNVPIRGLKPTYPAFFMHRMHPVMITQASHATQYVVAIVVYSEKKNVIGRHKIGMAIQISTDWIMKKNIPILPIRTITILMGMASLT